MSSHAPTKKDKYVFSHVELNKERCGWYDDYDYFDDGKLIFCCCCYIACRHFLSLLCCWWCCFNQCSDETDCDYDSFFVICFCCCYLVLCSSEHKQKSMPCYYARWTLLYDHHRCIRSKAGGFARQITNHCSIAVSSFWFLWWINVTFAFTVNKYWICTEAQRV